MDEIELRDRTTLLLDADLAIEERRALEALLRQDPDHAERHRELIAVWRLMDAYSPIASTREVARDLVSRAQAEARIESKGRMVRLAAGWAAAAAIFLAVFLGLPDKGPRKAGSGYPTAQRNGVEISEDYTLYASCSFDFEDF